MKCFLKNYSLRWVVMGALFLGGCLRAEVVVDFPIPLGGAHEKPDPVRDAYDLATLDQLVSFHPDLNSTEDEEVNGAEMPEVVLETSEVQVVSSGLSGPLAWGLAGGFLLLGARRLFD